MSPGRWDRTVSLTMVSVTRQCTLECTGRVLEARASGHLALPFWKSSIKKQVCTPSLVLCFNHRQVLCTLPNPAPS